MQFGYTFCLDLCPTALSDISIALEKLEPMADKVQPLFITVDPERETPRPVALIRPAAGEFAISSTQNWVQARGGASMRLLRGWINAWVPSYWQRRRANAVERFPVSRFCRRFRFQPPEAVHDQ